MKQSDKLNFNTEEDPFFSRVISYQNEKLAHPTKGNQVFFRSQSMSPHRSSFNEQKYSTQGFNNIVPNYSVGSGGLFTTRSELSQAVQDEGQQMANYFFINSRSNNPANDVNYNSISPQKNYFDKNNQIIEADQGSSSSSASKTQQNDGMKIENEDGNNNKNKIKVRNKEMNEKSSKDRLQELESLSINKIADYSLELMNILKQIQESHSVESVHNKVIREIISKQFQNIEVIPIENYYQSIKEFKEYFQQELSDLQRRIDEVVSSNKQIKMYEEKLKLITEDTNIDNLNSSKNSHKLNTQTNVDEVQQNPSTNKDQYVQQQNFSDEREGSTNRDRQQNDNVSISISSRVNNNLEEINKQLQVQIDNLLKQLQQLTEQKDKEIHFLIQQYHLQIKDEQDQLKLKQQDIDLILENHKHLSAIYTERIKSLEQDNLHLSNRIEEILSLGRQRESCLSEEVNNLRNTVLVLEKSLLLPINESRLYEKGNANDNGYCLQCGSNQIYPNKTNTNYKDFPENNSTQLFTSKQDLPSFSKDKIQYFSPSNKNQFRLPLMLTQSTQEIPQNKTNSRFDSGAVNASSTEEFNSAQKIKSKSIFLKQKNITPSNSAKKEILKRSCIQQNQIKEDYQEILEKQRIRIQDDDEKRRKNETNFEQNKQNLLNINEEDEQSKSLLFSYQDLQKEFAGLKLTPFNIKIEMLTKYFSKISEQLSNGTIIKNMDIMNKRLQSIDKAFNYQLQVMKDNQVAFVEKINTKAHLVIEKIREFEVNLSKFQNKGNKTDSRSLQFQANEFDSKNDKEQKELSHQNFKSFLSGKISQFKFKEGVEKQQVPNKNIHEYLKQLNIKINECLDNKIFLKSDLQNYTKEISIMKEGIDGLLYGLTRFSNESPYEISKMFKYSNENKQFIHFLQHNKLDLNEDSYNQDSIAFDVQRLDQLSKEEEEDIQRFSDQKQQLQQPRDDNFKPSQQIPQDYFIQFDLLGNNSSNPISPNEENQKKASQSLTQNVKYIMNDKQQLELTSFGGLSQDNITNNQQTISNCIIGNASQNSSLILMSREKSQNCFSPVNSKSFMAPQNCINLCKKSDKTIYIKKIQKDSQKLQSDLFILQREQLDLFQREQQEIMNTFIQKLNINQQLQTQFKDFSEFEIIIQQILGELKICKERDEKRFSLDTKANDSLIKENEMLRKQMQEQKQFYDNQLESAVQNLIIHQEFFDEKKKHYEDMNIQYESSISTLSTEINKQKYKQQHNFDILYDEFVKIHNAINTMLRVEKKIMISSHKGNHSTILAVETVRNDIQNIQAIQNKKLNSLNQIRKKITDKLQRIENHENLLTHHQMKTHFNLIQSAIHNFQKQNDFLENKLSEQKQGFRHLIQVQKEYYNKILNYIKNNPQISLIQ